MEHCLNFMTKAPLIKLSAIRRRSDVGGKGFTQALKHSLACSINASSGTAVVLELRQSNAAGARLSMERSAAVLHEVVRGLGSVSFSTMISGNFTVRATHTRNVVKALRDVGSTECEGG